MNQIKPAAPVTVGLLPALREAISSRGMEEGIDIDGVEALLERALLAIRLARGVHYPSATTTALGALSWAQRFRVSRHIHAFPHGLGARAWDILLELQCAKIEGRKVATTDVALAAQMRPTTALRLVHQLCKGGWVVRRRDDADGRRYWLHASQMADDLVTAFLLDLSRLR